MASTENHCKGKGLSLNPRTSDIKEKMGDFCKKDTDRGAAPTQHKDASCADVKQRIAATTLQQMKGDSLKQSQPMKDGVLGGDWTLSPVRWKDSGSPSYP